MSKAGLKKTGRFLVRYRAGEGKRLADFFHQRFGVGPSKFAREEDFASRPAEGTMADAMLLDQVGLAAVNSSLLGALPEAVSPEGPIVSIRPEYFLRRPPTSIGDAIAPAPPAPQWLQNNAQTWALNAIGMQANQAEGDGIKVGLVDSGVARNHPDLSNQIVETFSFVPGKSADEDTLGHGTHCAGLIAGALAPKQGPRYGVAPRAGLVIVRIFDADELASEIDVARAVQWAAGRGCSIISLSAGRVATPDPQDDQLGESLAQRNVLLVAAAGNESDRSAGLIEPTDAPANARDIPAVGALDLRGHVWNHSNGCAGQPDAQVDLIAPGTMVISAAANGTTTPASGTSVATPLVAGIAAVLASRDAALRGRALLQRLAALAQPLPNEPQAGVGAGLARVN